MESSLNDILALASKTGDTVIVLDEKGTGSVIIPFAKYQSLILQGPSVSSLSPENVIPPTTQMPSKQAKGEPIMVVEPESSTPEEPFFLEPLE